MLIFLLFSPPQIFILYLSLYFIYHIPSVYNSCSRFYSVWCTFGWIKRNVLLYWAM